MVLKPPFPWFGGKSRAAHLVWPRFGDVPNYVEPFFGGGAVLLRRPHAPRIETVNDIDCVAPDTRILRWNLTWAAAGEIEPGDKIIGFDENNGPARGGLRSPTRYRRLQIATVEGVRRLVKPCYRLTFDDGTTVVASEDHLWLGGSHKSGGRGWRWVTTKGMVCNRSTQRSWVLKVVDTVDREDSFDAGWLGGIMEGEGSLTIGPGLRAGISQNEGPVLDRAERILRSRGFACERNGDRRCKFLQVGGGMADVFSLLQRFRPERLISKLAGRIGEMSLYGRDHRAVGLVSKEFLGNREVVAIQTDTRTFIAEGLASHNCYLANFWRAVQKDPEQVARYCDWPVNEADLHARHRWLIETAGARIQKLRTDPEYFDAKVAGYWVYGQCLWIGSGWCAPAGYRRGEKPHEQRKRLRLADGGTGTGVHRDHSDLAEKRPRLQTNGGGTGVHRGSHAWNQRPDLSNPNVRGGLSGRRPNSGGRGGGQGVHSPTLSQQLPQLSGDGSGAQRGALGIARRAGLVNYMVALAERLRAVRVVCGDWSRVLSPAVTTYIGTTAVFLDPPYQQDLRELCYAHDNDVSADVRAWAIAHGEDPKFRIALCGYEGEHKMPDSWDCVPWKAGGGYGRTDRGKSNRHRERIWFSPHCLADTRHPLLAEAINA